MSSLAGSLNLRPQEKRALVVIGVIVFVILNFIFIFPHFSDWGRIKRDIDDTENQTKKFNATIDLDRNPGTNGWSNILVTLRKNKSGEIPLFSAIALQETASSEARQYGVTIQNISPSTARRLGTTAASDKYWESQSLRITTLSTEEALVNFFYNIGNNPAMIRVQDLSLRPQDANRYLLAAQITLTADYQRNAETNNPVKKAPTVTIPKGPPKTNPAPAATNSRDNRAGGRRNQPTNNLPPGRRAGAPPVPPSLPMMRRGNQ